MTTFLSTLSLRRATIISQRIGFRVDNFYPRSPCGERHPSVMQEIAQQRISIHALLAESDTINEHQTNIDLTFLSTLSLRRATAPNRRSCRRNKISIHALLAESDHNRRSQKQRHPNFYPRSPCGERHDLEPSKTRRLTFLSTLSLRRATSARSLFSILFAISIHALLAESDLQE